MRLVSSVLLPFAAVMKRPASALASMSAANFINDVNTRYETLHRDFEHQFWGTKVLAACWRWVNVHVHVHAHVHS